MAYAFTFEPRRTARGGTTRRNQYGVRQRGEFNEYDEPMGTQPAVQQQVTPTAFDSRFGQPMNPPRVLSRRIVSGTPALAMGGSVASMGNSIAGAAMMAAAKPVVTQENQNPQGFKSVRDTPTGGKEVWQESSTSGGRWVPTTSLTPISRGGVQGTVTDKGATPFTRRGTRTLSTTGGEVNEYDPRKDASIAEVPKDFLPPGAARAVTINPKYQTPGASPIASITGGEITQNGGRTPFTPSTVRTPMAQPVMQPRTALPSEGGAAPMSLPPTSLPTPNLPLVPAVPLPQQRTVPLEVPPAAMAGNGPATVNPFVPPRGDLGGALSDIGSSLHSAFDRVNRGIARSAAGPGVNLDSTTPVAPVMTAPKALPVAKETLPVALDEDEVRRRNARRSAAAF